MWILLGLGDMERVLALMEAGDRDGVPFEHANVEPRFERLRTNPRFIALMRRHGFSP